MTRIESTGGQSVRHRRKSGNRYAPAAWREVESVRELRRFNSFVRTALALSTLAVSAVYPLNVAAVVCPAGGAQIEVCVTNPTGSPVTVNVSGANVAVATCTGPLPISNTYNQNLTIPATGVPECTTLPASGLWTGLFIHRINVASTTQSQAQRGFVLIDPLKKPRVEWTYFPSVITVNQAGADGAGPCPINQVAPTATCDVRTAINTANGLSGSSAVLIRFTASPGAIGAPNLIVSRINTTLDGTDNSGLPWLVADPNAAAAGNQSPFPTLIEFLPANGFRIAASNVKLRGLELRHSDDFGNPQANLLSHTSGFVGTVLDRVRLDGGAIEDCLAPGGSCTEPFDTASIAFGTISMDKVEVRSAIDKGVQFGTNVQATIRRSWLHNNYKGNLQAASSGVVTLENSVVERGGLRNSDDMQVSVTAHGASIRDAGNLDSRGTVFRNNVANGVNASGFTTLSPENDYICGNGADGLRTTEDIFELPSVTSFGGLATAYNQGHGARVLPDLFAVVSLNDDSAFTANASCGLFNEAPPSTDFVDAVNNQWRGAGPPFADECGAEGGGDVDSSFPQDSENGPISVTSVSPSNVLLKGQTVRIFGAGFNAIHGNPLAGFGPNTPDCGTGIDGSGADPGQTDSCCQKTTKANTCGAGVHNPILGMGNCVEILDRTGTWRSMAVRSLTPAMMETEIPVNPLPCIGAQGEMVSVSKRRGDNLQVLTGMVDYCTNTDAF